MDAASPSIDDTQETTVQRAPSHEDIQAAITARSTWEDRQATWYQMRHDGLRRRNKPWPNAADMHFALADGIIEKLKPTFISQVYATDTIATFAALKSDWASYQSGAAQWFDYQLKQESNFEEQLDIAIDRMLQSGKCPVKLYWSPDAERIVFEAINPLDLIVPPWTGALRDADWIVHVQRYSKAKYLALPETFKKDKDTLAQLMGSESTGPTSYETQRTIREGINQSASKEEIVVWEIFYRDEKNAWRVQTKSPAASLELRPEFGLPYNRGVFANKKAPAPFGEFNFEVKEAGYYSPRGVCERVAPEETSLCKDWNTIKDYQTLTCSPVFYAKQGVPDGTNIRMIPGQILPFEIAAVQFPQIPVDLYSAMQGTRTTAEERLSVPSVGVGRQVDPSKNKTAAETNLISSIMSQSGDVRARAFRRQLGEVLNLAWGLLVQYRGEALDYYFNDELMKLDRQAFEGDYRIEPSGSGDNNNRAMTLQRAISRKQMFTGNQNINQKELDRSVLEADDPRLVKRLLLDEGTQAAEQMEDQAEEIGIMLLGYPAQVKPSDDDASHLQSLVGFVQRRASKGEPLTGEFLSLVAQHAGAHLAALKKKNPQVWAQKGQQLKAWLAEVQQHAQQATQAEQAQMQQQQQMVAPQQMAPRQMGGGMGGNVVPMTGGMR